MIQRAYYNEIDRGAAQWLRNLIAQGSISEGYVDDRSIKDVDPDDITRHRRCHFFAGIGGWDLAMRLAGVPDDLEIWSGSCPCQPFSQAGKGRGTTDERHLWPDFFRLISVRRPRIVVGEQVASPAGLAWLDAVFTDLEGAGYACRAADLCAASVSAPHIRQRLFWLANRDGERLEGERLQLRAGSTRQAVPEASGRCEACGVADPEAPEWRSEREEEPIAGWAEEARGPDGPMRPWNDLEWLSCRDGKLRPTQPGLRPLAHGVSRGMARSVSGRFYRRTTALRGFGNAIVPQVAAIFLRAVFDGFIDKMEEMT